MSGDEPPGHLAPPGRNVRDAGPREAEFTLADILLVLVRNVRLIGLTAGAFAVIGVVIALASPREYEASAMLIRESDGATLSPMNALRSLGVPSGGTGTGLTAEVYPDIVRSREVSLAVVQDTFYFADLSRSMRLADYLARPDDRPARALAALRRYTIGLPGLLLAALRGADPADAGLSPDSTKMEVAAAEVRGLVSASVDFNTGVMRITVRTQDPQFSAALALSFVEKFTARVRQIRTEKSRRDLAFVRAQFSEASGQLEAAESELEGFLNRNRNLDGSPQLSIELERFRRKVGFREQLYSQLQAELAESEINLQRSDPVVTLLEAPAVARTPAGPSRSLTVLLLSLVGLAIGVTLAFIRTVVTVQSQIGEEIEKWRQLRRTVRFPRPSGR